MLHNASLPRLTVRFRDDRKSTDAQRHGQPRSTSPITAKGPRYFRPRLRGRPSGSGFLAAITLAISPHTRKPIDVIFGHPSGPGKT
ncbi:hypothetical protein PsYK624_131410 [Phanerochaete sordida]|uniref:Uncharacterized protein n=1 Tax=Phanerochaete sordida TaxID=48140 RepID=A0A9P3GKI2_9APHY|nr:hypothetical protein PsYK624_131410 [Phanerochaete sordida]